MKNSKQQLKIKITVLYFVVFSFSLFVLPLSEANAARLFLEAPASEVGVGQKMEIVVRVDSENEVVNAFEGTITFPSGVVVREVRDGSSLVSFWAERPRVVNDRSVVFSGIIPGGWNGARGELLSMIVETQSEGRDGITISDARVLLHDGLGTQTTLTTPLFLLSVDSGVPLFPFVDVIDDTEPPEPFTPIVAQDPSIFDGDYFVVFAAQDKGTGIDRYEIFETLSELVDEEAAAWKEAESPHRLQDQTRRSYVYVRAVDRAGNTRVAIPVPAPLFDFIIELVRRRPVSIIPFITFGILLGYIIFVIYKRIRNLS
ncbi:MAG: hypothetical protein IIA99_03010 [Proteobacteria bacterium]|nr:hypothetical protein [Pseudomonadota bacterium]